MLVAPPLDGQVVAAAQALLQEHPRATTLQAALTHDGDAVPEQVCLVHEVRRQHHRAPCQWMHTSEWMCEWMADSATEHSVLKHKH